MQKSMLRKTREASGQTLTEVSIRSGYPLAGLSRVERGAKCSQPVARRIAKAMGVAVETVFPSFSTMRKW